MKRAALSIGVVLAACVPASEKLPPRGAAGFQTVPSPATAGEPFTTSDGWTVRVDKLFIQASVAASPTNRGYGTSLPYLFDARKPARVFARALPAGPAKVNLALYGRYLDRSEGDYEDRVNRIDVDDATDARFNQLPDEGEDEGYTPGPSVLLVLRGERNGRALSLDMALNVSSSGPLTFDEAFGVSVDVREDELSTAELPIDVVRFFPTFDDVAASDTDGDGRVTAVELRASHVLTELEQRIAAALAR